eukprot:4968577-Pleurochrysis_carterae.AAC.1
MSEVLESRVLALRVRLCLLLVGEAKRYNDDDAFQRMVGAMIETKNAAACANHHMLSFVASALSSKELQEGVGAEFCIKLLGRTSEGETNNIAAALNPFLRELLASFDEADEQGSYVPAMLRIPAATDGGDELVVPVDKRGVETLEWQQRAGATAVLAKLELSAEDLPRLFRFEEVFIWLLSSHPEARQAALVLLQKLQTERRSLTGAQSQTTFKVLQGTRRKFKLLSFVKGERNMLSRLLAPRVADLKITPLQLREAGFDLECLGQAGCTVASLCSGAEEPDWAALIAEGFTMAELRAVGWSGDGFAGTLEGHRDRVRSVCVTPDGEYLVTASDDSTARVWRLANGKHVRKVRGCPSVAFLREHVSVGIGSVVVDAL